MSLGSFFKKQFIDVIQWTEDGAGVLAYRYPMQDMEIQNGAQLTVRESQMAVFVNEGEVADIFWPGPLHARARRRCRCSRTCGTGTSSSSRRSSPTSISSRRGSRPNQRWGTPKPITIRDKDFGIGAAARPTASTRITSPTRRVFHQKVAARSELYTVAELEPHLRNTIVGQGVRRVRAERRAVPRHGRQHRRVLDGDARAGRADASPSSGSRSTRSRSRASRCPTSCRSGSTSASA